MMREFLKYLFRSEFDGTLQYDYYMSSGPSFSSAFIFSVNSLILSNFPLTCFHLAEASISVFKWLYTLVCAVVQKYHKMFFIFNYYKIFVIFFLFFCAT